MSSLETITSPEVAAKVTSSKVLVVGAGGIGSELLKNLVLAGFHNITLLDLDTIEVSNLNRQFLFRKKHVGQPKALVAKEAALRFNPNAVIDAFQMNIKDEKFSPEFVSRFQLVFSALDNIDARNYLNVLCFRAQVPLLESGTQGYLGQAYSICHGINPCQGCIPPQQKTTFALCTIRNTPDKPEHCIAWAKNIYAVLFDEPGDTESDFGIKFDQIDSLHIQAHGFTKPTSEQSTDSNNVDSAHVGEDGNVQQQSPIDTADLTILHSSLAFLKSVPRSTPLQETLHKVFQIVYYYFTWEPVFQRSFKERWLFRQAPIPLPLPLPRYISDSSTASSAVPLPTSVPLSQGVGTTADETYYTHKIGLEKQQRQQPIGFYLNQFITATFDLMTRQDQLLNEHGAESKKHYIGFDKDDQLAMAFVAAASNLRMYTYHIPLLSEFALKGIAGNIIHAIATTNAIAAGLLVSHALKLFEFPQLTHFLQTSATATKSESSAIKTILDKNCAFHWVNSQDRYMITDTFDAPSIKCWCSKPVVHASFSHSDPNSDQNPFDLITTQEFMLMIEGSVGGIGMHDRIQALKVKGDSNDKNGQNGQKNRQKALAGDNIASLLENSTNIEDFNFIPIDHQDAFDLQSRLDGFYYKLATPRAFAEGTMDSGMKDGNGESDCSDDDDDDDDGDDTNPLNLLSLSKCKVKSGTVFKCNQVDQGMNFVVKCYDEKIVPGRELGKGADFDHFGHFGQFQHKNDHYTALIKAMMKPNKVLTQSGSVTDVTVWGSRSDGSDGCGEVCKVVFDSQSGAKMTLFFNRVKLIEIVPQCLKFQRDLEKKQEDEVKAMQLKKNKFKDFMAQQRVQSTTIALDSDDDINIDNQSIESVAKKLKGNENDAVTSDDVELDLEIDSSPIAITESKKLDPNALVTIGAPTTQVITTLSAEDDVVELD